jgi:nudix-type nucleoside diphosphatase (YffH/AdpP family)
MERLMRKVELISRKRVFDDVFKIEEARLRFERYDGTMSEVVRRLNFERGDSAAALLVNREEKRVYLTEQFKYPSLEKGGGWIVEVVAGKVDPGETAERAIKREIMEELGFQVNSVEPIANFFVSPGGTSERIFLFGAVVARAERTASRGGFASENEDIKMIECPVDEFLAKTQTGQLADAKTIIAGYWLKENYTRIMRS